jgi:UPF0716 family protein affecting phage T7 exclusion
MDDVLTIIGIVIISVPLGVIGLLILLGIIGSIFSPAIRKTVRQENTKQQAKRGHKKKEPHWITDPNKHYLPGNHFNPDE